MAAKTFMRRVAGVWREIVATVISTGPANAGDILALDDSGHLDASVMPVGYGADVKVYTASEPLSAGNLINTWLNGSTDAARKADASSEGKPAIGYVLDGAPTGAQVTVFFGRKITGLSGIVTGRRYYLSTTPGAFTDTPVTGAGKVDQFIGTGASPTEIAFEPDDYIVKAA